MCEHASTRTTTNSGTRSGGGWARAVGARRGDHLAARLPRPRLPRGGREHRQSDREPARRRSACAAWVPWRRHLHRRAQAAGGADREPPRRPARAPHEHDAEGRHAHHRDALHPRESRHQHHVARGRPRPRWAGGGARRAGHVPQPARRRDDLRGPAVPGRRLGGGRQHRGNRRVRGIPLGPRADLLQLGRDRAECAHGRHLRRQHGPAPVAPLQGDARACLSHDAQTRCRHSPRAFAR